MLTQINDLHVGAKRSSGTTMKSALALRQYLLQKFNDLLNQIDTDLLINGDWLDTFTIDAGDLFEAYTHTSAWIERNGRKLYLACGNHDIDRDTTKTSSFDLLAAILQERYPNNVILITKPSMINDHNAYVIPHLINQEAFDAAIAAVPEVETLYLHCNYSNEFAVHADHSLNLSEEQAIALPVRKIVIAHEHQHRKALDGKVFVVGNQFPSSIADCLGNKQKIYLQGAEPVVFWKEAGSFEELDWKNLTECSQFVRVIGEATSSQAADVVAAIARFRASSKAFVITNAVKISGLDDNKALELSQEQISNFSVRNALEEIMTPEENAIIDSVMEA